MERPVFSEILADRRRELGYSIRQASRVLRLREDVLIAFEEGDYELMPKMGYAQGMLSSYARYLGLDANEVVEAYLEDYERYKREERRAGGARRGRGRSNTSSQSHSPQPYVASKGLLPTSGGPAGDMGSFATTRVHTRFDARAEEDSEGGDVPAYEQARPYTGRTPSRAYSSYREGSQRGRRDIETMEVEDYQDDLRLGYDARPYEAATSRAGRRSGRAYDGVERPRVNRRSRGADQNRRQRGRTGRSRNDARRRQGRGGSLLDSASNRLGLIVVVVVILILSIILILSVGSCASGGTSSAKTVPVSAVASTQSTTDKSSSSGSTSSTSSSTGSNATSSSSESKTSSSTSSSSSSSDSASTSSSKADTSVSVKVEDGAVTWLEIECDGKSDVAETVTGPWQKTFTVKDAITVQAGDTAAVSVVQDGQQVQFESMASGIGTIRIQGNKSSSSSNDSSSSKGESSSNSSSGSSAKTGKSSSTSEQDESGTSKSSTKTSAADEYGYDSEEDLESDSTEEEYY